MKKLIHKGTARPAMATQPFLGTIQIFGFFLELLRFLISSFWVFPTEGPTGGG